MREKTERREKMRRLGTRFLTALAALSFFVVVGGEAMAQKVRQEGARAELASVSNPYLKLVVDNIPGDEPQGDFALLSTGGDPLTNADNNRILSDRIDPYPQDMRQVVAVDWTSAGGGKFLRFGSRTEGEDIKIGEVDAPRERIVSEWEDNGKLLHARWTFTLLRDVVEMRYRLTNVDTISHTYGLRITLDTRPNATGLPAGQNSLPEAPLFIPGSSPITEEVKYGPGNVPDRWFCGVPSAQQVTTIGGFLANFADARRPDEFHIGELADLQADPWEFKPEAGTAISDAAVSMRWNPVRLSPNQSVEFVTYFGYSSASGDYSSPFVLAGVSLPRLTLTTGDNPNTPEVEQFYISPDPLEFRGYVYNVSDVQRSNAQVSLSLPAGFEFEPGESQTKLIDVVPAHAEEVVSWNLHPTGDPAGTLICLLSANVTPSAARAVTREIQVPPLAQAELPAGVQMFSIPFELQDASPDAALSFLPPSSLALARWSPRDEEYLMFPGPSFGALERGRGYWVRVDTPATLNVGGATPAGLADVFVALGQGWNQIGNPFELPIEWGRVKVAFEDQTMSLLEAVRTGLLRSTLFRWDPIAHEYRWSVDTFYKLQPWAGYWVKAALPCSLVFERQETTREGAISSGEGRLGESRGLGGGWVLQLFASMAGGGRATCAIGASPEARDGYDSRDIEAPPAAVGAGVTLRMPHSDWAEAAGNYLQDVRRQGATGARWEIEVLTEEPSQDVLLAWPDMRGLPKEVALYLEREDTRQRFSLRTTQGIRLNTGAAGKVRVAVVSAAGGEMLVVSTPRVDSTKGSLSFSFDLSTESEVTATISNLAGLKVKDLVSGLSLGVGSQSLAWDGKDNEGRRLPAGSYLLEIEALAWDGQRFVATRTFSIR